MRKKEREKERKREEIVKAEEKMYFEGLWFCLSIPPLLGFAGCRAVDARSFEVIDLVNFILNQVFVALRNAKEVIHN